MKSSGVAFAFLLTALAARTQVGAAEAGARDAFLSEWLETGAGSDVPFTGGRIEADGCVAWQGSGSKLREYKSELGRFSAWDLKPGWSAAFPVKAAFMTFGTLDKPRKMAVLVVDVVPADGDEHAYALHLPTAGALKVVDRLVRDYSAAAVKELEQDAQDYADWRFKYLLWYGEGGENFCADLLLRHAREDRPDSLLLRVIHPVVPWDDYAYPATYEHAGDRTGGRLVLPADGKEMRLVVLFFGGSGDGNDRLRARTVWQGEEGYVVSAEQRAEQREILTELQVDGRTFLNFRRLENGRTVFKALSTGSELPVGWDDDRDELEMILDSVDDSSRLQ